MFTPTREIPDLWHYLQKESRGGRPVVLYGMGNGADKILDVCAGYGITVRDCFASDGFVRGHSFHGRTVLTFDQVCRAYGAENLLVLLSFATARPEVLSCIEQVAARAELYVPDVPVCGEELFTAAFCQAHREELESARGLFADEASRRVFDGVITARLSGRLDMLRGTATLPEEDFVHLLRADRFRYVADLGAYTGDSLRELMTYAPGLQGALAMEPDARTFRKLSRFARELADSGHGPVIRPVPKGAWSWAGLLTFSGTGNRNASLVAGTDTVQAHAAAVAVDTPDAVWDQVMGRDTPVDFIKYDVEGAEAEALRGSRSLISRYAPALLVSAYHRSEDLFTLPLLVRALAPRHALYLRRRDSVPAWDINLYALPPED